MESMISQLRAAAAARSEAPRKSAAEREAEAKAYRESGAQMRRENELLAAKPQQPITGIDNPETAWMWTN